MDMSELLKRPIGAVQKGHRLDSHWVRTILRTS